VIKLPRRAELTDIRSSHGASNGSVHASKTRGKLAIASNAAVQVRDIEGETSVQTSNGAIHADLEDNRSARSS